MFLTPTDARLCFKLQRWLMYFVNERLQIIPNIGSLDEFPTVPSISLLDIREAILSEKELIDEFADANPFDARPDELEIVRSWRHQIKNNFFIFRELKNYTVFISTDDPPIAYGVKALTQSFGELIGPDWPVLVETVLMPLHDQIVFDGVLRRFNISFSGSNKRGLNEDYKQAKALNGIITSLPVTAQPVNRKKPKDSNRTKSTKLNEAEDVLQVIIGMTDRFCRERLNEEYAESCRKLAAKLARKRPTPLLRGKPVTWAAGIVRTIGWVNDLDDRTTTPYMKLTAIDKEFGVGESTGQGKSKQIRTMLKINNFTPEWTLPSHLDDNPAVWMLEFNGFLIDVRHASREIQELAFKKGLIPYIPADR